MKNKIWAFHCVKWVIIPLGIKFNTKTQHIVLKFLSDMLYIVSVYIVEVKKIRNILVMN